MSVAQKGAFSAPLVATTTTSAGAVLSIANPEGVPLIITNFVIDVTTDATGTVNDADFGVGAGATTTRDNLIDGCNIGTGTITSASNDSTQAGTAGRACQKWAADEFVVGNAKASTAGLVGRVYIEYIRA